MMYLKALKTAIKAHRGQVDKAGKPYIFHPIRVSLRVRGKDAKIVALLHDVIEDSNLKLEELDFLSAFQREALALLTHSEDEPYFDYIQKIKGNELAKEVKLSDLRDNSNLNRLKHITQKDEQRREKYLKAISFLED